MPSSSDISGAWISSHFRIQVRSADECVAPGRRQSRETRWTSDGRLSSPETNLKVGLLPLFFMQLLLSHMFLSFMVRTSPLSQSSRPYEAVFPKPLSGDKTILQSSSNVRLRRALLPEKFLTNCFVRLLDRPVEEEGGSLYFVWTPKKQCLPTSRRPGKPQLSSSLTFFSFENFWKQLKYET